MRANDIFAGSLLVAVSLYGIYLALQFPSFGGLGPAFFPLVLLGILLCCALALIVSGLRKLPRQALFELDPWARSPRAVGTLLLIPAAILFYIATARTLGFLVVAPIIMFVLLLWGRGVRRAPISAALAVIFPVAIYWTFAVMLRVPLPAGILRDVRLF